LEDRLIGSELRQALDVIRETDNANSIIEINYVLGTNSNFNKTVHRPVVIRSRKKSDRYILTITYF